MLMLSAPVFSGSEPSSSAPLPGGEAEAGNGQKRQMKGQERLGANVRDIKAIKGQ